MKPDVLILDEPTAGLDPRGRDEILGKIQELYEREGITIVLVSHSMEDIAKLVNRIIVMHNGKIAMDGNTREIFNQAEELEKLGLGIPQVTTFMREYKAKGNNIKEDILTIEEAKIEIINFLRSRKKMLKDITIGQYFPGGDTFVHKLDPRIKILISIMFIISLFFY